MPDGKDEINGMESETTTNNRGSLNRRRVLQVTGVSIVGGLAATGGAMAKDDDHSHTIVFETTGSSEASYEFLVSGSVDPDDELGSDEDASIRGGHVTGTVDDDPVGYRFSGHLSFLDASDPVEVTIRYDDEGHPEADRIEIIAEDTDSFEYTFTTSDESAKVLDNGEYSADEGTDSVTENGDGTYTVEGVTGSGDTYDTLGEFVEFHPVEGPFTLFLNGEETTVTELTGQEPAEEDEETDSGPDVNVFSIRSTDETPAMFYEFAVDGEIEALEDTRDHDEVFEEDDGWRVEGQVGPNGTDSYNVAAKLSSWEVVDRDGEHVSDDRFGVYWNGEEVSIADVLANGDDTAEEDEDEEDEASNPYPVTIRSTSDTPAMHYRIEASGEIEKGTNTFDHDEVSEGDDGWIVEGQVGPSGTDTYHVAAEGLDFFGAWYIDTDQDPWNYTDDPVPVQHFDFEWDEESVHPEDVTDEVDLAEADKEEDSNPSNGELGIRHDEYDGPVGGGEGYEDIIDQSDADIVVPRDMSLGQAASNASSGDVVYIANGETIYNSGTIVWSQNDLTIAGSRGDTSVSTGQIVRSSSNAPFDIRGNGVRLTGISIDGRGNSGTCIDVRARDVLIDNCEILDNRYSGMNVRANNPRLEVRQCHIADHAYGGLGYGIQLYWSSSDRSNRTRILYNEFENNRRHVPGGTSWYEFADNRIVSNAATESPNHGIEVRANTQGTGQPAGNAIVQHNELEQDSTRLMAIRGVPTEGVWIERNVTAWDSDPCANANYWGNSCVVLQPHSDQAPSFSGVAFDDNQWGQ